MSREQAIDAMARAYEAEKARQFGQAPNSGAGFKWEELKCMEAAYDALQAAGLVVVREEIGAKDAHEPNGGHAWSNTDPSYCCVCGYGADLEATGCPLIAAHQSGEGER